MTGKRISSNDERKMTAAIERAATLASADAGKNRDKLLADCLMEGGVDSRFAKAASAGFNKRVSVLTFQKASDDNRANSFQLTDADRVESLMGAGARGQAKAAAFTAALAPAPSVGMSKAASAKPAMARVNYEDRVTADVFERHLVSVMQKLAADQTLLLSDLGRLQAEAGKLAKEASAGIEKIKPSQIGALRARYGERLQRALPCTADVAVARCDAVLDDTAELRKVAAAVQAYDTYVEANNAVAEMQGYMRKFAADAEAFGNRMHKLAVTGPLMPLMLTSMKGVSNTGLGTLAAMNNMRMSAMDRVADAYQHASDLADAARVSERPSKVLDSAFLLKDRASDRLMAISDLMADPFLARQEDAGKLFTLANKAMDLDQRLERPDQRELLRVYVSKLLPQSGMVDEATAAALSNIESNLGKGPLTASQAAAGPVFAMDDVAAPQSPASAIATAARALSTGIAIPEKADFSDITEGYKAYSDWQKEHDKDRKAEKEKAKERLSKEEEKALAEEKAKAAKQLADRAAALKQLGIHVGWFAGKPEYLRSTGKGTSVQVSEADVRRMLEQQNKLLGTNVTLP